MMAHVKVTTFLSLNGKAQEAISFYQKNLDAKVRFQITNIEIQAKMDPEYTFPESEKDFVSHSVLEIGSLELSIIDDTMDEGTDVVTGNNLSLCLYSSSLAQVTDFYERVTMDKRTKVIIPLGKNFFAEAYAIVKDPFGVIIQFAVQAEGEQR